MAELTAKTRNKLPAKKFGDPKDRKYPMPDASHAADAKGRATQMLKRGVISEAEHAKITSKANRILDKE